MLIIDSDEETEKKPEPQKAQPTPKKATEVDQEEAEELNEEFASGRKQHGKIKPEARKEKSPIAAKMEKRSSKLTKMMFRKRAERTLIK